MALPAWQLSLRSQLHVQTHLDHPRGARGVRPIYPPRSILQEEGNCGARSWRQAEAAERRRQMPEQQQTTRTDGEAKVTLALTRSECELLELALGELLAGARREEHL